ncbi:hypothetical protein DCC39_13270 [Pueribacillus theae]|uniref:Peptidoglycan binding-like domain-containing protein n=1 Tax=Pueribacillus theae TaxID=2171751 RepID=A0A2U1JW69_9BACI|nr:peptidoglycan-binding domain-containing protein [Pueribacillus theae]PWA09235.1 hypothetical protein DCC39_13270 [Pueribacillus theae]
MRISKQFVVTPVLGLAVLATPLALPTLGGTTGIAEAASGNEQENEQVQLSESAISPEFQALFNWPPEEQPIVKQGSQSFEVEFIQVMLNHFGFETEVDGVFGSHTDQQVHQLQAEKGLAQDGIVGVDTWTILLEEYEEEIFTKEKAINFAEEALDNGDLVFSGDGALHQDLDGQVFYSLRAQSKDYMEDGGSGTVGFYDVYQNGDVVESKPR